jgi:hypothetical protein
LPLQENCKPLKKESEEDYRRWKDLLCSCRINIVKTIPLKAIKMSMTFITEIENSTQSSFGSRKDHE